MKTPQTNDTPSIDSCLDFDHSFQQQLTAFYEPCAGQQLAAPQLVKLNQGLAQQLGLNTALTNKQRAHLMTGSRAADGAKPLAQTYAGHQFGSFNPQLGDGRAVLLGEVISKDQQRLDIHLKGSGKTPFSRGGDGKAALGPVLREYLLGEAMHALGVPATRALAVTLTGEKIMRQNLQHGAVLARVASSHIRVGTFQYFAARGQKQQVTELANYTINRHFPELSASQNPYRSLLKTVCEHQAQLVAQWMQIGFVHGVMNTDNVAISGQTIDFGPCAFIDGYEANAVFSSIDRTGRYALGNQPIIAQWNMARFAESILHLLDEDNEKAIAVATELVENFTQQYHTHWLKGMNAKLGLSTVKQDDSALVQQLLSLLQKDKIDFTQFFRQLSDQIDQPADHMTSQFSDHDAWLDWHKKWLQRLSQTPENTEQKVTNMNAVNPLYIPRNHLVEEAIKAAEDNLDFAPFEKLLTVLTQPFDERAGLEKYTQGAPEGFGHYQTFCGT